MGKVHFHCALFGKATPFAHFWEHTVGGDYAPMALRADCQTQLRRCHEELGFRMGKVRILPRREELKLGEDQGRDPIGIVPVDFPRERDEFLELPSVPQFNGAYRDRWVVQTLNPAKRRPARLAARVRRPCKTSRG